MTSDPGGKMYDVLVEHKARLLVEHLRGVSPETQAQLTPREIHEAMLDALTVLEKDTPPIHDLDVVRRAKTMVRSMLDQTNLAT